EKNRVIALTIETPKPVEKPPVEKPKPLAPPPPSAWPWVAVGVGVVGAAGFATFALIGNGGVRKLEDKHCEPNCPDSDVRAIKRNYLIADIALGVAVVSFAVATYGFATREKPVATVSLGLGSLSIAGTF